MPALELAMRYGRALGLAPYDYTPSQTPGWRGKYTLNSRHRRVRLAVVLLLAALGFGAQAISRPQHAHAVSDGFSVLILTRHAVTVFNSWWTYSFLPLLWWRQHPLLLQVLNSELFRGLPPLPRKNILLPFLRTATVLAGLAVSVYNQWKENFTDVTAIWSVSMLLLIVVIQINTGLFVFLVSCVLTHINAVNDSLQEMAGNSPVTADAIDSLRRKHRDAFEATEKLCSAFGWTILTGLLEDSVWMVQASFLLIAARSDSVLQSLAQLIDIMKTVVSDTITIVIAHKVAKQANFTTLSRIHAVRNSRLTINKSTRMELHDFSLQICQQPIIVSVNRLVVLDMPLYLQGCGVIATYVVVLLQLHQNMD